MAQAIVEHVKLSNSTTDLECWCASGIVAAGIRAWWIIQLADPPFTWYAITASDVVITPDTGPAWACALEPMPKIALLSHASAENITKHWLNTTTLHADQNRVPCWPCHKLHDTKDTCVENKEKNGAACISDISVETIMGHVKKYLAQLDKQRDSCGREICIMTVLYYVAIILGLIGLCLSVYVLSHEN